MLVNLGDRLPRDELRREVVGHLVVQVVQILPVRQLVDPVDLLVREEARVHAYDVAEHGRVGQFRAVEGRAPIVLGASARSPALGPRSRAIAPPRRRGGRGMPRAAPSFLF